LPSETKRIAATYARVSKEDAPKKREGEEDSAEHREGLSIPEQVEDTKDRAEKEGYGLPAKHVYVDDGYSGKLPPKQWREAGKKYRPALSNLIEAVESHQIHALIIRKRDRLARNTLLLLRLYHELEIHKVKLICTHETLPESNDASGRFTLTVLSAAAQLELDKTSENILATKKYSKRHGRKLCTAKNVFGYTDGEVGRVEVDQEQAEVVREVFHRYLAGDSASSICRWLTSVHAGLKLKHLKRPKMRWRVSSVTKMIRNPHYAGYDWVYDDDGNKTGEVRATALWGEIIDKETYWLARNRYEASRKTHARRNIRLFSGIMNCGYCGGRMVAFCQYRKKRPPEIVYRCQNKHKGEHPLGMRAENYDLWYEYFFSQRKETKEVVDTPSIRQTLVEVEQLAHQLAESERMYSSGKWALDKFNRISDMLESNITKLKKTIDVERKALQQQVRKQDWEELTLEEKREDIRSWVKSIKVFSRYVDMQISGDSIFRFPLMHCRNIHHPRPFNALVPPTNRNPNMGGYKPGAKLHTWMWSPMYLSRYFCYANATLNPKFGSKVCPKCGKEKALSEFPKSVRASDGLTTYCKTCNWVGLQKYRKK